MALLDRGLWGGSWERMGTGGGWGRGWFRAHCGKSLNRDDSFNVSGGERELGQCKS